MKKVISIAAVVLGVLLVAAGIIAKTKESASIAIIGGADGPTSIFLAGEIGSGGLIGIILLGVVSIITGIVIFKIIKRNKQ